MEASGLSILWPNLMHISNWRYVRAIISHGKTNDNITTRLTSQLCDKMHSLFLPVFPLEGKKEGQQEKARIKNHSFPVQTLKKSFRKKEKKIS